MSPTTKERSLLLSGHSSASAVADSASHCLPHLGKGSPSETWVCVLVKAWLVTGP